jgi:hypothetical protein
MPGLLLSTLLSTTRAGAQDVETPKPPSYWRPLRLEYRPDASIAKACPSEEVFRWMVQQFTKGEDPFTGDRLRLDRGL